MRPKKDQGINPATVVTKDRIALSNQALNNVQTNIRQDPLIINSLQFWIGRLRFRGTFLIILVNEAFAGIITVIVRRFVDAVFFTSGIFRCDGNIFRFVTCRRHANVMANYNAANNASFFPFTALVSQKWRFRNFFRVAFRLIRRNVVNTITNVGSVRQEMNNVVYSRKQILMVAGRVMMQRATRRRRLSFSTFRFFKGLTIIFVTAKGNGVACVGNMMPFTPKPPHSIQNCFHVRIVRERVPCLQQVPNFVTAARVGNMTCANMEAFRASVIVNNGGTLFRVVNVRARYIQNLLIKVWRLRVVVTEDRYTWSRGRGRYVFVRFRVIVFLIVEGQGRHRAQECIQ